MVTAGHDLSVARVCDIYIGILYINRIICDIFFFRVDPFSLFDNSLEKILINLIIKLSVFWGLFLVDSDTHTFTGIGVLRRN